MSCSSPSATKNIRATLFLLDASKSNLKSVESREQQLRERLKSSFSKNEAIYFDFIRSNLSKQIILPLVSMQTIVNVEDLILSDINNERRQDEAREEISNLWSNAVSSSSPIVDCIENSASNLELNTVLGGQAAVEIAQNICVSSEKTRQTLSNIKIIGSGGSIENGFIGSDIEGAFTRGLDKLESEARNLMNIENLDVKVRSTVVISSDMMQRDSNGRRILDLIINKTEEEIDQYLSERSQISEFSYFRPIVKIDGWLSTKRNFSEEERIVLETYWRKWFLNRNLDEPDFGLGVIDWSVEQ